MAKRPDVWTRLLSWFAGSRDLEEKERHTEEVVMHAQNIRAEADKILKLQYAEADKKYRGR